MQKKFILLGLKNRALGRDFFKAVLDSLERYSIDLTHIDYVRLRFETPHTKTWFVFEKDRSQWYDGIRADAIFGSQWKTLLDRATKDTYIAHGKGTGLVEYICKVEKEASESYKALEIGHALHEGYLAGLNTRDNGVFNAAERLAFNSTTDKCVADMYPPTLFMKPLTELEKRLYRQMLNATYGKYGTFSSKPRKLDPALFNNEEIKPLANDKNPDGLRTSFPVIDEWDSYKNCVTPEKWPKVNPYLYTKNEIDRQLIYALGRGNGKSTMCLKELLKDFEKKKGVKTMDAVTNDLIMNKNAQLTTEHGTMPVRIDELEIKTRLGGDKEVYFEGHMVYPTLNDIIDRRVDYFKSKPSKLPGIKTVHFSGPVTAVIWADKTKTIVRANDGEFIDYEKGLAMAIAKKALGTNESGSNYYDIFKKYLPKPEIEEEAEEVTE